MMSYWAEFARSSDPKQGYNREEPLWLTWYESPSAPQIMLFDAEANSLSSKMGKGINSLETIKQRLLLPWTINYVILV